MNHESRISKVRQKLTDQSLDAALITSIPNITYLTGYANFSSEEREAYILVTKSARYILTDGRYTTEVKKQINGFAVLEISTQNPFRKELERIIKKHKIHSLGIEEHNLTVTEYNRITPLVKAVHSLNLSGFRIKKEPAEIAVIEKACRIGDQAFDYIIKQLKPNTSEKRVAILLEHFIEYQHAEISFKPIIAFGVNAAVPHHQTSDQRLRTNDLILLDFGVKYKNYCSDMTRTVFIGKATDKQKKIYNTVIEAQQKAVEFIQENITIEPFDKTQVKQSSHVKMLRINVASNQTMKQFNNLTIKQSKPLLATEVDNIARQHITSHGYSSIPHSLGHGIGLQVHEPPTLSPISKQTLEEEMVFSIEPGIYLPDYGGVRIEDLYVIEKNKLRHLTKAPKNLTLL